MPDQGRSKFSCAVPGVPEGLNRAAFLLIAGYLFILPISHTTTIREILFLSLVFVTLWSAWRYNLALHLPGAKAWAVYAAVASLSLFYALNPIYSLKEIKAEIVYSLLAALAAASWIRDRNTLSRLLWVLVISDIFLSCYAMATGIYTRVSHGPIGGTAPLDIGRGKFSTYIVTVLPLITAQMLCTAKYRKPSYLLYSLLLVVNLVALYFTENRAGWQALFVELILLAWLLRSHLASSLGRKAFVLTLVTSLAILIIPAFFMLLHKSAYYVGGTSQYSISQKVQTSLLNDERFHLWGHVIGRIKARPLSGGGFGLEAFKMLDPEYPKKHPPLWHAHNAFLNKGVQMGIPGILAFCLLIVSVLHELWPRGKHNSGGYDSMIYASAAAAMLAGVMVKNLTDDFFTRDNGWMFWLLAAAVIGAIGEKTTDTTDLS